MSLILPRKKADRNVLTVMEPISYLWNHGNQRTPKGSRLLVLLLISRSAFVVEDWYMDGRGSWKSGILVSVVTGATSFSQIRSQGEALLPLGRSACVYTHSRLPLMHSRHLGTVSSQRTCRCLHVRQPNLDFLWVLRFALISIPCVLIVIAKVRDFNQKGGISTNVSMKGYSYTLLPWLIRFLS